MNTTDTEVDLQKSPNSVPFASRRASASSLKVFTITTGPNISSLYASEVIGTFSSIVGSMKEPWACQSPYVSQVQVKHTNLLADTTATVD